MTAYSHEYLIHFRKGCFSKATSGQGAQEMERDRRRLELDTARAEQQAEARRLLSMAEIEALQKRIEVENTVTPMGLQRDFVEKALPAIPEAMAKNMDHARLYIDQGAGGGTLFKFMLGDLMELMQNVVRGRETNSGRKE